MTDLLNECPHPETVYLVGPHVQQNINGHEQIVGMFISDKPAGGVSYEYKRVRGDASTRKDGAVQALESSPAQTSEIWVVDEDTLVERLAGLCANGWDYGTHPKDKARRILSFLRPYLATREPVMSDPVAEIGGTKIYYTMEQIAEMTGISLKTLTKPPINDAAIAEILAESLCNSSQPQIKRGFWRNGASKATKNRWIERANKAIHALRKAGVYGI